MPGLVCAGARKRRREEAIYAWDPPLRPEYHLARAAPAQLAGDPRPAVLAHDGSAIADLKGEEGPRQFRGVTSLPARASGCGKTIWLCGGSLRPPGPSPRLPSSARGELASGSAPDGISREGGSRSGTPPLISGQLSILAKRTWPAGGSAVRERAHVTPANVPPRHASPRASCAPSRAAFRARRAFGTVCEFKATSRAPREGSEAPIARNQAR